MSISIRPLGEADLPAFRAHFARHRAESGRGDPHFMPFAPDDPDGPRGLVADALNLPLTEPGWQRWFIAADRNDTVIGHVNLKGGGLKTGLHRCELGIGIQRDYRGHGLGERLMKTAIEFAQRAATLSWIDLSTFAHNAPARALYRKLGFAEVGVLTDRFRIDEQSIDDVIMTLNVE